MLLAGAGLIAPLRLMPRQLEAGARVVAPDLAIVPRSGWATGLPQPAELPTEAPGDVRVLLVHHTASRNDYGTNEVVGLLRGIHGFHTAEKGWPDIAYNFLIDRFGQVWEGRSGSLDAPVIGDATGGNQGFSQLVCLIGDHRTAAPSVASSVSLNRTLAWLASRYGIDPAPGAMTTFVSRGSNRWPQGDEVTTRTIAGHRDMSQTVCPGDQVYDLLTTEIPRAVATLAGSAPAPTSDPTVEPTTEPGIETPAPDPPPVSQPDTTTGSTPAPTSTSGPAPTAAGSVEVTTTSAAPQPSGTAALAGTVAVDGSEPASGPLAVAGLGAAALAAGGAGLAWSRRRWGDG